MSQLHKDLNKRIDDKLHQWFIDSANLYKMADLDMEDFADDILTLLTAAISAISVEFKVHPKTVIEGIVRGLAIALKAQKEESRQ
jgi:hypothetical protein